MPGKGKPFSPGDSRAGRPKGVPNKASRDVRAAIASSLRGTSTSSRGGLDRIAEKDPAKAADLFARMLEYHVPRLARTELSGEIGARGKLVIHD